MAICKDCIHFEICSPYTAPNESYPEVEGGCRCFKDKARFIEMPCKVGDTVYFLIDDEISGEAYIDSQQINDVCTRGIFVSSSTLEENCDSFESYSNFGKTVFLTPEEAEQALAERQGETE